MSYTIVSDITFYSPSPKAQIWKNHALGRGMGAPVGSALGGQHTTWRVST